MSPRLHWPLKVEDWLLRAMVALAEAMALFMAVAVSWSVLSRRLLQLPLAWVTEVSAYLLLYIAFLAAPWVAREDGHVRVELLQQVVGHRGRRWLEVFSSVISVATAALLVWYGALVSWQAAQRGAVVANVLNTPRVLLLAVIPLGSLFTLLQYMRHVHRENRGS